MSLVQLTDNHGYPIFINPEMIVTLDAHDEHYTQIRTVDADKRVRLVEGNIFEVAEAIEKAGATNTCSSELIEDESNDSHER